MSADLESVQGPNVAGDTSGADGREQAADAVDPAIQRRLAVALFNRTWELLGVPDRTPEQVDELIGAAHASRYHWSRCGTLANECRGEWQIARVYATLGRTEPALWHARRCVELAEAAERAGVAEDWDIAAALEGLARAEALAGLPDAAATHARATAALEQVADEEDRELIARDLAAIRFEASETRG